jgi:hypothetical protein
MEIVGAAVSELEVRLRLEDGVKSLRAEVFGSVPLLVRVRLVFGAL